MRKHLPPISAIKAFEAVGRLGTMQRAAIELNLTPAAISHQVKSLEKHVGAPLFARVSGRLELSETGVSYLKDVARVLDLLDAATQRVRQDGHATHLTIYMYHSLAELWFVPLLKTFLEQAPDLTISVLSEPEFADFAIGKTDLAITYGTAAPKLDKDYLFDDVVSPCCSKSFLHTNGPITTPDGLLTFPLIRCTSDPHEWSIWFAHAGIKNDASVRWIEFDMRAAALQAAREGIGVAMGRRPYCDTNLARRQLVEPLDIKLNTGKGYFLTVPERTRHLDKVVRFSKWLRKTCA